MSLTEKLFLKSKKQSQKYKKYFNIYDEIFHNYRNKKITFVEIGILEGGSLEIWKKFFGNKARIIGIDANPECKKFEKNGYEIYIGDQSDKFFWKSFFNKVGNVDIVLDDGGHTNEQQINTIINCVKNINDGGILIVEDTHTSYMKDFGNPHKFSFINFAKKIIDDINFTFPLFSNKKWKFSLNKYIYSIIFYESIAIFKIGRDRCKTNELMFNSGKSLGIKDFRHNKSSIIKIAGYIRKKIYILRNVKLKKINYFIKNFMLYKFFK